MPAKDLFHDIVKRALERDGWKITNENYQLEFGGVEIYIDLAAEPLIIAEQSGRKIAVEVKSFIRASTISEFHAALGQFINYRTVLRYADPDRQLYLAVPAAIYQVFFTLELVKIVIREQALKLIVYTPDREEIESWIE
jgi:hypothetical protein